MQGADSPIRQADVSAEARKDDPVSLSKRTSLCPVGLCFVLSFGLASRSLAPEHHFSANIGGGFTAITGSEAGKFDHGGIFRLELAISSTDTSASPEISCSTDWVLQAAS
jgi:hypothetical protein